MKRRILHIITTLDTGGAEMMLYRLLGQMSRDIWKAEVISLAPPGDVGEKIERVGIPVHTARMTAGPGFVRAVPRLASLIRRQRPDIIQTWMYHADLLGSISARMAGARCPVVWGLHHSNLDRSLNRRSTLLVARLCSKLSRILPSRVVCCSEATLRVHALAGYTESKLQVIENGFDTARFQQVPQAREALLARLGLPGDILLVGMAARFDSQKDHPTFVQAAALTAASVPQARFVLAGGGVDGSNVVLRSLIESNALTGKAHLLGPCSDMPGLLSSLDVLVSSSLGEGFPNVIGEAMCCQRVCVVTDVGDSARLVGDAGFVSPPGNVKTLAANIVRALALPQEERERLGKTARQSIIDRFSLPTIARRYEQLYEEVLAASAKGTAR